VEDAPSDPLIVQMMPHDVATCWNSTYDMLVFALEYCQMIDKISVDRDTRKYELSEEEWELVQQLCDVLEVCCAGQLAYSCYSRFRRYSRMRCFSFHIRHQILPL